MHFRSVVIVLIVLLGTNVNAGQDFQLELPIKCNFQETCFLQNYVDRDPGPDATDYMCGVLTYDGHSGTDFRLRNEADLPKNVAVIAAAPGRVRALRDGQPDISQQNPGAPDTTGKECGNGVAIEHSDGWESRYCHLAKGSISVSLGDVVPTGQLLGFVGLSGLTEFPHFEFSLRKNGTVVDPFDRADLSNACSGSGSVPESYWSPEAEEELPAPIGAVMEVGIAVQPPSYGDVKAGTVDSGNLDSNAPALVLWTHAFGLDTGDRLRLALRGPAGENIADSSTEMPRPKAQYFSFAGRKARGLWPAGLYEGCAWIERQRQVLHRRCIQVTLKQ